MVEIIGLAALTHVLTRALVANKVIDKEDLLAEISRIQLALPAEVVNEFQELVLNLPDQYL
jgi:hypothetical protein